MVLKPFSTSLISSVFPSIFVVSSLHTRTTKTSLKLAAVQAWRFYSIPYFSTSARNGLLLRSGRPSFRTFTTTTSSSSYPTTNDSTSSFSVNNTSSTEETDPALTQSFLEKDLISKLLNSTDGTRREIRQYIQNVEVPTSQYATILIEEKLDEKQLKTVANAATIMYRAGLHPLIVYGDNGIQGLQSFSNTFGSNVWRDIVYHTYALCEAIENAGGRATPVVNGVYFMDMASENLGESDLSDINFNQISTSIQQQKLPVIATVAESQTGNMFSLNPLVALSHLSNTMHPRKILYVSSTGGLRDRKGKIKNMINLSEEFQFLISVDSSLTPSDKRKLRGVNTILQNFPLNYSASIVSPEGMLRELFTDLRSREGTLIRRGVPVTKHFSLKRLDIQRLTKLLEDSFRRKLHPDYFKDLINVPFTIYIGGDYGGCAILTHENAVPYMCKLSVSPNAQGQGVVDSIWYHITKDHPSLYWRSRQTNIVNSWYFDRSDGNFRTPPWIFFYYGLKEIETIEYYKNFTAAKPPTFI